MQPSIALPWLVLCCVVLYCSSLFVLFSQTVTAVAAATAVAVAVVVVTAAAAAVAAAVVLCHGSFYCNVRVNKAVAKN